MDFSVLIKGLIIGFSVAAPIGPIGILCVNTTLNKGRLYGMVVGLGAAAGDAVYGGVASFGLTVISELLINYFSWFKIIGAIVLFYLGWQSFFNKPNTQPVKITIKSYLSTFISTLFYTLTNPMMIILFTGLYAALGMANSSKNYLSAFLFVLGIFVGSMVWWLILAGSVSLFKKKINDKTLTVINKVTGLLIIAFGLLILK